MPAPTSDQVLRYETVGVHLRAPRVAVVFEGGPQWQVWARDAMRQVTGCWGGAGFVLIPHHRGVVNPALLPAVQAYDPDFVVAARQPRSLRQAFDPATAAVEADQQQVHVGWDGMAALDDASVPEDTWRARTWLARHCNPYARLEDGSWEESETVMPRGGDQGQLTVLTDMGVSPRVCLAVPSAWGGPVATAAAMAVGALAEPDPAASATPDDAAVLASLLGVAHAEPPHDLIHWPNGVAMSMRPSDTPSALDATTAGLALAWTGGSNRLTTWVLGDTADDFALAMILNRLHVRAQWIDPAWGQDPDGTVRGVLADAVSANQARAARAEPLELRSTSMSEHEREQWLTDLGVGNPSPTYNPRAGTGARNRRRRQYHYTVQGQHDRRHTLPLLDAADGSVALAAAPPLPSVEPGHPIDTRHLPVQVDLIIPDSHMPTGRGLDAHALARDEEEGWLTWLRSSRDGISYQSQRFDFVLSSATSYGALAAPRVRAFGLSAWVAQMATQAGHTLRSSDAGRRTDVLAQLWGGRAAMTEALGPPCATPWSCSPRLRGRRTPTWRATLFGSPLTGV